MDANFIYVSLGISVIFIDGVREDLLIREASYKTILVLSSVLFVLGIIVHFTAPLDSWAAGALFAPMLTLIYFRLCLKWFVRWQRREPVDTTLNWTPGLVKDRTFGFAFSLGGVAILLGTIWATHQLAKAGW